MQSILNSAQNRELFWILFLAEFYYYKQIHVHISIKNNIE